FELFEVHFLDFRAARDISHQSRHRAPAIGTRFEGQPAVNVVPGSITQDYCSAGLQRSENDLARLAWREDFSRSRINDFNDAQVRIEMVTAGRLAVGERTLGPGHFSFRKAVDS